MSLCRHGGAAPGLGVETAVTAEPAAGSAAAEGEADAPLAAVAQLAAHQVLFEDVVLAGSFEEGAIAGEVAAVLGEVGDDVPLHAPAAHRDDIEAGNGPVRLSRRVVRDAVAPDDPCGGKIGREACGAGVEREGKSSG